MKAGPFYNELLHQLGEPLSCSLQVDDGRIQLTYAFPDAAQLVAQVNRNIEYSEQRMQVTRMEASKALELLKAADKDAYPPNGCGIAWAHPEKTSHGGPGGTREVIYRGDVCNCQARVTYRNNYAVSLALKSAC